MENTPRVYHTEPHADGFFNFLVFISYACALIYSFTWPGTSYRNYTLASAKEIQKKIINGDVTKPIIHIVVLAFFIFFYSYFSVAGDKKKFFDEHITLIFSMIFLFIFIIILFGLYYTHKLLNTPEYNELKTLVNNTQDKLNKEINSIYSTIRNFLLEIDGSASKPGEFLCSVPKINTKLLRTGSVELMEKVMPLLNTIGISPALDIDIKDIIDAIPDITTVLNELGDSIPSVELVPETTIDLKSFVSDAGQGVKREVNKAASSIGLGNMGDFIP